MKKKKSRLFRSKGEKKVLRVRLSGNREKSLLMYEFMEVDREIREKKLFLQGGMCIQDIAALFGHNRTRMSEIVNKGSGMSFNNYFNWYRVQYMMWLLACDPEQLIEDASMKSGFGSQPSMNSAFRKFIGMKPSDIARFHIKRKPKRGLLSMNPVLELIPPQAPSLRGAQKLKIWREGISLRLG